VSLHWNTWQEIRQGDHENDSERAADLHHLGETLSLCFRKLFGTLETAEKIELPGTTELPSQTGTRPQPHNSILAVVQEQSESFEEDCLKKLNALIRKSAMNNHTAHSA
jgi:hypothetical protein